LILWSLRIIFILILFFDVLLAWFFLAHRSEYPKIVESKSYNIIEVILYNACCYLVTGIIPEDTQVLIKPGLFNNPIVFFGFRIIGITFIAFHGWLILKTFRQRNVIGMQNTKNGLITWGTYGLCRHPIYVGIVGISLGLALITLNWDGMIIWPIVLLLNILEAIGEEKYDLIPRFEEDYRLYREKVRSFGNVWYWTIMITPVLILTLISQFY